MDIFLDKAAPSDANALERHRATMKRKYFWQVVTASALCCGAMLLVDGVWQPGYLIKSLIKISLFLAVPILMSLYYPELRLLRLLKPKKQGIGLALALGVGIYALLLAAYFIFKNFVDFSGIAESLTSSTGVSRENFLWVSLYISLVNSLLEEFFFRGFVYYGLKGTDKRLAAGYSCIAFSLYHTAMMAGWFPLWVFLLCLAGLAVGGGIFIWLNSKQENIYTSWLTHMFCNFAINTIGFMLL